LRYLGHQLAVHDGAVLVEYDDGTGKETGDLAIGKGDAEGGAKIAAEGAGGHHVGETLGAAETALGERQVGADADHDSVVEVDAFSLNLRTLVAQVGVSMLGKMLRMTRWPP